MAYDRKATIKATAEWQREQNYTHFATATFEYGNNFTEEQNKMLSELSYCNKLVTQLKYQLASLNVTNDILIDKIKKSLET